MIFISFLLGILIGHYVIKDVRSFISKRSKDV